ncbi:hypothetical protein, partial [Streptomyces sp. NPDC055692]|uniref:hypothetical protein n=1 Tax=Streptomyces sp. NPDC055692 TaxID=3155683 RepID=UPI00343BAA46
DLDLRDLEPYAQDGVFHVSGLVRHPHIQQKSPFFGPHVGGVEDDTGDIDEDSIVYAYETASRTISTTLTSVA